MSKKDDYQLEYVYSMRQFKKKLWWCFGIWLVLRILRAILYLTFGIAFLSSIPAAFIFFGSGMVLGIAAHSIWRYRYSVRVDDVEAERILLTRMNKK